MPTIKSFNNRLESLRSERSSFMPYWGELSDYHLAHRGRFLISDKNKGFKRNTKQFNNTSRLASRTLASGMMAGITSPARPWFKLQASDPDMNEIAAVKEWLHQVEVVMYLVFSQSNTYNSLHSLYAELGVFGTGAMGVFEDFEDVIRCKTYTVGSYMIGANGRDEVDTLYREYENTVAQLVKRFGYDNCSQAVQQQWDTGNTEAWVPIVHAVEPNDNRDHNNPLAKFKTVRSVYYEKSQGSKQNVDKFLLESGFDEFPMLVPRWDIAGEDVYSSDSPGMLALGDAKSMQLSMKRKAQALDKIGNPALLGSPGLKNKTKGGVPGAGELIYGDKADDTLGSIYGNYRPDINAIAQSIAEDENRVKRAFYEDLFLMLANSDRRQITAREIAEKQEEKLLMLGPVLERLHTELLDPLIDRTFNILQGNGVLPPPPPALQGKELNVEYVSVLAQAQRMVAVGALERTIGFVSSITPIWPAARYKIDPSQAVDEYSHAMGVNPRVVRPDDEAEAMAAAEAEAAAAAAAPDAAQQMAETAKTASETDTGGDSALAKTLQAAGLQ